MSYVDDCLNDHIARMEHRLKTARKKRDLLNKECEVLEREIDEIKLGIKNWQEESEQQ